MPLGYVANNQDCDDSMILLSRSTWNCDGIDNDLWLIGGWWRPGGCWAWKPITGMRIGDGFGDAARTIQVLVICQRAMSQTLKDCAWYRMNEKPWNTWQLHEPCWCTNWQLFVLRLHWILNLLISKIKVSAIWLLGQLLEAYWWTTALPQPVLNPNARKYFNTNSRYIQSGFQAKEIFPNFQPKSFMTQDHHGITHCWRKTISWWPWHRVRCWTCILEKRRLQIKIGNHRDACGNRVEAIDKICRNLWCQMVDLLQEEELSWSPKGAYYSFPNGWRRANFGFVA